MVAALPVSFKCNKDGRTSFGFRLVFQSISATLTDDEINMVMEGVYSAIEKQNWETQ